MRSNRYLSYVGVYETSRSELLMILNFSINMRYIAGVQTGVLDMVRTSSVSPTHCFQEQVHWGNWLTYVGKQRNHWLPQVDIVLDEYSTSDQRPGIKRKIQGVAIHPNFDEETLKNDLAVVTLRAPVSLTSGRVTPIWTKLQKEIPFASSKFETFSISVFGSVVGFEFMT